MAYECPVCESVQVDGGHLANHIAFTAMIHNDEHEAWLDEHAAGWSSWSEEELAETVLKHAEKASFPNLTDEVDVPEPAIDHNHSHGHEHANHSHDQEHADHSHDQEHPSHSHNSHRNGASFRESTALDQEAREILEEAKELTEKRRSEED